MAVELGVLIPTRESIMSGRPETGSLITMAERAEAAGFDSVWIGDSITARPRHEPLTLMAAIAARTRRVRLGTGVLLPALRNPVVLAHLIATVDRVAEGRVILGVGIAADGPAIRKEFAACGVPWDRRVGRFLETLEICRALWTRDGVTFGGQALHARGPTVEPKPHRPGGPPIWIGGSGPTAFREAARFDAWFPTGPSVEFFAEHFPRIQAAARAAGRPADAVAGAAYVTLALDPEQGRGRAAPPPVPRDVLLGARRRVIGSPGHLRGAGGGLRGVARSAGSTRAPATWPCASRAATSSRRSTRPRGTSCPDSRPAEHPNPSRRSEMTRFLRSLAILGCLVLSLLSARPRRDRPGAAPRRRRADLRGRRRAARASTGTAKRPSRCSTRPRRTTTRYAGGSHRPDRHQVRRRPGRVLDDLAGQAHLHVQGPSRREVPRRQPDHRGAT